MKTQKIKRSMFAMSPSGEQYDSFWNEIKQRNLWLIRLRYGAVVMIICLIFGVYLLENGFSDFYLNTFPHWIIAGAILFYNLIFQKVWKILPDKIPNENCFHSVHFALLQIGFDFFALMLFIYFTGGIETPLFAFFIFHVIIASLLLSHSLVNLIITLTIIFSSFGAILECINVLPHYSLEGLWHISLYDNLNYLVIYFALFSITLYLSSYLANSIASNLYDREQKITVAYSELENAEKTKSRYVMTVVHDLKTPIAAASTYLDMLLDGTLGELQSQQLKPIERSKARLNGAIDIIKDILQISQLKLDANAQNLESVDIVDTLNEIINDHRVILESKNIEFNSEVTSTKLLVIQAEPKMLRLALANLVSNAAKYTENDGKVEFSASCEKGKISITVADTGIGIPENEIGKIFRDFYRTNLSKKKAIEGTGLGLTLVKQIVEMYGGSVTAKSPSHLKTDENRPGTEFTVTFNTDCSKPFSLKLE